MLPNDIARSNTETAHQTALFAWAALHVEILPELEWLHHIPNGGSRGDDSRSRAIRGGQLKAQGVRDGVSDLFLPVFRTPYSGLYIEMKRPELKPVRGKSMGGLSQRQRDFAAFVTKQGYSFAVCYSWIEARDVLLKYLTGRETLDE